MSGTGEWRMPRGKHEAGMAGSVPAQDSFPDVGDLEVGGLLDLQIFYQNFHMILKWPQCLLRL